MGNNRTAKNIISVTISNVSTIASGVFVGFLLPKMISVEGYGFYKIFTLYCSYIGLFTLGLHDGIILEYGGKDYADLDKKKFRSYFKWYVLINSFFSMSILLCAVIFLHDEYRIIFSLLAVNIMANNIAGYFQQISQITQRFTEYSIRKIINALINILSIGIMFLFFMKGYHITYLAYVILFVLCNLCMAIWYINTYREIVFGQDNGLIATKDDAWKMILIGFPLTISNLCSLFILAMDRQFVSVLFPNATYAVYAFAYNMLSLVTVATSAVSTVLYPLLKRTDNNNLQKNYSLIVSGLLAFVSCAMLAYFPLRAFIHFFLPKYDDSFRIFRVIFPGLGVTTVIDVAMHNYYKTMGKNFEYFKKSVWILLLSGIVNVLAYVSFKTTVSISIVSIFTMLVWYVVTEQEFVRIFHYERWKNLLFLVLYMLGFYVITAASNVMLAMVGYVLYDVILIFAFFWKEINSAVKAAKRK